MGNISLRLNRQVFVHKCGCCFTVFDKELLDVLEDAHTHFVAAVTLDCACR